MGNETDTKGLLNLFALADKEPYDTYEHIRDMGSPVWDPDMNAWIVVDFEQCAKVSSDETVFGNIYSSGDPILRAVKGGDKNITFSQGDEHRRLRRFHLAVLSTANVKLYNDAHIRPIVDYVFDRIVDKGRCDLFTDMAMPIVPRIISSLLGMPYDDEETLARIVELNDAIFAFVANSYKGEDLKIRALAASDELNNILRPYVRARKAAPRDDMISRVWQEAPVEYGDLSEDDAISICRELYFAGSDTTIHGATNTLYMLLTNPEQRAALYTDPDKVLPAFIEEALRLQAVVQMRHRLVKEDTELGGKQIRAGDVVIIVNAAANRDPGHYGCPHSMDLARKPAVDHLSFGRGQRACVGAGLARREIQEMVRAVMARMPNIRLDDTAPPPRLMGTFFRSYRPLNVVWDV